MWRPFSVRKPVVWTQEKKDFIAFAHEDWILQGNVTRIPIRELAKMVDAQWPGETDELAVGGILKRKEMIPVRRLYPPVPTANGRPPIHKTYVKKKK